MTSAPSGEQAAGFDADAADAEVEDTQAGERTSALRRVSRRRGLRDGSERIAIVRAGGGSRAGEAGAASVEDEEAVGDATLHAVGNCGIAESFALGEIIGGEDLRIRRKHRRHREAAALRLERQLELWSCP